MKIKLEVFEVIKQGTLSESGNEYFLPNINLDRKLYTDTNKVLEGLGFKWNKKSKSHINSEDVSDKVYNMIDTGKWLDVKKELQFFPTPKKLVDRMVEKIQWNKHLSVLEPSCGIGDIAFNLLSFICRSLKSSLSLPANCHRLSLCQSPPDIPKAIQ